LLFTRHQELFYRRWIDAPRPSRQQRTPVPEGLIAEIAAAAAGLSTELAGAYTRTVEELDSLRDQVQARDESIAELEGRLTSLLSSTSWRVSAPLRALGRRLRRP
jgi:hypothetical protein